ncbi:hypothetical protein [Psychroflexus salis]|uniref:Uncharacterized protein n=1 Tax=Psychroflexus salis TaxID=1526574 RepID=A0A916ZV79_9FLAO|nr:hypothetical protein [Psychroflexus salis]GGE15510.1 hypothetical protein GCM10010831_16040 [Psychroflexus salis]
MAIEQSDEEFNTLVHIQFFDGLYYDSIRNQLYDLEKTPIDTLENILRENIFQIKASKISGNLNQGFDIFTTVEAHLARMNAKAIPICDVFINCTHQI